MDDLAYLRYVVDGHGPLQRAYQGQSVLQLYSIATQSPGYVTTFIGEPFVLPNEGKECFLEVAGDVLADLLHLAEYMGVKPKELFTQAKLHYKAERWGCEAA